MCSEEQEMFLSPRLMRKYALQLRFHVLFSGMTASKTHNTKVLMATAAALSTDLIIKLSSSEHYEGR